MLPDAVSHAVKEWAVVIEAIRTGKQVFLLRKGGLIEPDAPEFERPSGPFVLAPTYLKQKPELVRAESARAFSGFLTGNDDSYQMEITTLVEVTENIVLKNPIMAHRLWDNHVWRADHLTERINTRPDVPLHLLFVRAHTLKTSINVDRPKHFADRKAWIEFGKNVNIGETKPVLQDPEYRRETRIVRELLQA